jgi:hypothetical protein
MSKTKIDLAWNKAQDDYQDRLIKAQYTINHAVAHASHVMDWDEIRAWFESAIKIEAEMLDEEA